MIGQLGRGLAVIMLMTCLQSTTSQNGRKNNNDYYVYDIKF